MAEKKYKGLCYSERVQIATLYGLGKTKSFIAKELKRSRSTISREINNWIDKPGELYDAELAQWHADDEKINKRNGDKLFRNPRLRLHVYKGLLEKLSPEAISGRLKVLYPDDASMHISHETIYQHIYSHRQAKLNRKLINLLTQSKTYRHRANQKSKRGVRIKEQTSIEQRPIHIELRLESGHWEGDLIIGPNQKSCLGTLVERVTRYVLLIQLPNKQSENVQEAFSERINELPEFLRRTMTYDNGVEMAQHKKISEKTGMDIYFAHPYHSWERGSNENMNGVIRRFWPKKTDFNKLTSKEIMDLEKRLNNRPRKVLGYQTPREMLIKEFEKHNMMMES